MASEIKVDTIVNAGGDNDSGIDLATNDNIKFKIANSQKAIIDANGNVGIGTSSPSAPLNISATYSSDTTEQFRIQDNTGGKLDFFGNSDGDRGIQAYQDDGSTFYNLNLQPLGGNLLVNKTSQDGAEKLSLNFDRTSQQGMSINNTSSTAPNNASMIEFRYAGTTNGSIGSNGSSTSYNTSSDYRLKENIVTDWDATSRLKQLKPSRFNFKVDKNTTVDGFLAHEVSDIVPEAISGEKDAVDKDGNIEAQSIDQSKLVPLLVKTVQELEARLAALESK